MRTGVLYRPTAAYKVVILRKTDPHGSDPWTLYQTIRVDMVNASPVLSIGLERAAFANRKTTIHFDPPGTLTDVAIDKDSEAVGFGAIPLAVAQAIVDVPAQILQIRIADTQSHAALIQAQGNLFQAVSNYNQLLAQQAAKNPAGTPPRSTTIRSGEFVGGCIDAGGDPTTCSNLGASVR